MDVDRQLTLLTADAVDVISRDELEKKLDRGAPLRVKLGIDPTASDVHLGFAVVLRRLRQFQDCGHVAVLIIGDYTAMVGDPSGRSTTRPRLSRDEIDANARTYVEQIADVLDMSPARIEVRRNSEWLEPLQMDDVLRLTAQVTVARMLERDDFAKRYAEGTAISLMEFLYPLLQALDSVEVRADVELGGTDQLFNLIMGRHMQERAGQEPQVVLTMPLLVGLDGVQKMSKSLRNYVGLREPANEQFGKLMSIPDHVLPLYLRLATAWEPEQAEATIDALTRRELHPNAAKRLLARTVVDLYGGAGAGAAAESEFDRVFRAHETPSDMPTVRLANGTEWPAGLVAAGLAASRREGARLIAQGGVRCDGDVVDAASVVPDGEHVVQVGRRKWARFVVGG